MHITYEFKGVNLTYILQAAFFQYPVDKKVQTLNVSTEKVLVKYWWN